MKKEVTEKQINPVEALKQQLMEAEQKELEAVSQKVEALQEEHQVTIGLQLDIRKLTDIIAFMISNNKPLISLKFEVWKPKE
jgi:ABC-type phosphate transport system auxiliary subunit